MKRNKAEREALQDNFFLASKADYWVHVKMFIRIWEKIVSTAKKADRPEFFRITGKGKIQ